MYKIDTKNQAKRLRLRATMIAIAIGRTIVTWGAIEKNPILLSQYCKT